MAVRHLELVTVITWLMPLQMVAAWLILYHRIGQDDKLCDLPPTIQAKASARPIVRDYSSLRPTTSIASPIDMVANSCPAVAELL